MLHVEGNKFRPVTAFVSGTCVSINLSKNLIFVNGGYFD